MNYLLYSKSTGKTGRALAKELGLKASRKPVFGSDIVIRWGNSSQIVGCNDIAVNTPTSIKLASDGFHSLLTLTEHGIHTPLVFYEPPRDEKYYPLFGRKIHHRAGLDIVICNDRKEAVDSSCAFFTRYTPVTKELRLHVIGGKVVKGFRKYKDDVGDNDIICTSEFGWHYRRIDVSEYYENAQETALAAVEALGLFFGGVDLGWDENKRKWLVFEVNTGPSLNSKSLALYAKHLGEYICSLDRGEL